MSTSDEKLHGRAKPLTGPVVLAEYDPAWPRLFARDAERIRKALGDRALQIEHAGSTSVRGLAAKPVLDVVLAVRDSAEERAYVPPLETIGYALGIREPDWFEHRVLKRDEPSVNLHVFSEGCAEIERMLLFRDRLRSDEADRGLYERTKHELARKRWTYMQDYADAKSAVVGEILARARSS